MAKSSLSERVLIALWKYALVAVGVVVISGIIAFIPGAADVSNIALLYLLIVMGAAYALGRGPAVLASFLSVIFFDWLVQKPRYSLGVDNPADWLELLMMLVTAMVISQLTTMLRQRAEEAHQSEREAAILSEISWAVASQVHHDRVLAEVLRRLTESVPCTVAAIITQQDEASPKVVAVSGQQALLPDFNAEPARSALGAVRQDAHSLRDSPRLVQGTKAGAASRSAYAGDAYLTDTDKSHRNGLRAGSLWQDETETGRGAATYLPLMMEKRVLGVLYLNLPEANLISHAQRRILESLINYATVALERQRLIRTESQARALAEADRLKTALLSMVSHDFRSPLSSIKASVTGLLQEGVPWDSKTQHELLFGINQETDRLNRMVGNILALSRLEAGDWRPQCELVPLDEVIGAALDSFGPQDNCRIHTSLDPALIEVWLDSVQIVQVLHNLLENALKYSPAKSSVELWARAENDNVVFEVLDHGPGLTVEEKDQIFERFYRSPRWRESSLPGTGIGLAICSGLVEAHQGQLTAENREGGGTVFQITLPLHPPVAAHK